MFDFVSLNKPVLGEESRQILIDHFLLKVRLRKHYLMKKKIKYFGQILIGHF